MTHPTRREPKSKTSTASVEGVAYKHRISEMLDEIIDLSLERQKNQPSLSYSYMINNDELGVIRITQPLIRYLNAACKHRGLTSIYFDDIKRFKVTVDLKGAVLTYTQLKREIEAADVT